MSKLATVVQLETMYGVIGVELYDDDLSGGLASAFERLAMSGQLDGKTFQTLVPGVGLVGTARGVAEGRVLGLLWGTEGCGFADVRGNPKRLLRHVGAGLLTCLPVEGVVPTSTFMITLGPQPKLDKEYIIFARICSGMGLLEKAAKMQVTDDFKLYSPIEVLRTTVVQQPRRSRPAMGGAEELTAQTRIKRCSQASLLNSL